MWAGLTGTLEGILAAHSPPVPPTWSISSARGDGVRTELWSEASGQTETVMALNQPSSFLPPCGSLRLEEESLLPIWPIPTHPLNVNLEITFSRKPSRPSPPTACRLSNMNGGGGSQLLLNFFEPRFPHLQNGGNNI